MTINKVPNKQNVKLEALFNQYLNKSLEAQQIAFEALNSSEEHKIHKQYKTAVNSASLAQQEIIGILKQQSLEQTNNIKDTAGKVAINHVNDTKELFTYFQNRNDAISANLWMLDSLMEEFKQAESLNIKTEHGYIRTMRKRNGDNIVKTQKDIISFITNSQLTANIDFAKSLQYASKQSLNNETGENLKAAIKERDQLVKAHILRIQGNKGKNQETEITKANLKIKKLIDQVFKQASKS